MSLLLDVRGLPLPEPLTVDCVECGHRGAWVPGTEVVVHTQRRACLLPSRVDDGARADRRGGAR